MTVTDPTIRRAALDPAGRSFIEMQFPVAKLSKESYKERSAKQSQTLTGLGKWWGRKPLVLVRAVILGLLLPATKYPQADLAVFLALMTMDEEGLLQRWTKSIPAERVSHYTSFRDREALFESRSGKVVWKSGLRPEDRKRAQRRAFLAMSYDEKLAYCLRPEEIEGPSADAWQRINDHLGTDVQSIPDLVRILGERRWGHCPRVGDAFSGGGSIPYEAARMGCTALASDLNPVAGMLSFGATSIVGGGKPVVTRVSDAQQRALEAVKSQIREWGIEQDERGWSADAYLYCNEVRDPNTGWWVPLAPSWVIGQGTRTIARLIPDGEKQRFDFEIVQDATAIEVAQANREGTSDGGVRSPVDRESRWLAPQERTVTSLDQLRGAHGLRRWASDDLAPRPGDVYQERLYCIRWVNPETGERQFRAPSASDLSREQQALSLLTERFEVWQARGIIPGRKIESGQETDRLFRERGWTHWHHLFNPRQLLVAGLFAEQVFAAASEEERIGLLLALFRVTDWNNRLCRWNSSAVNEIGTQLFYNQAFNTLDNYAARTTASLATTVLRNLTASPVVGPSCVVLGDARTLDDESDIWITDPGYGDAIMYDELSEFFLAWSEKAIPAVRPNWYTDSRRALSVEGDGASFRAAMAECYANLARHMPDDGVQVVMFVHQDPEIWADVGLTLWAAGLHVQSAWTVVTETSSAGVKARGNYVQGTVNLVLRKRVGNKRGDLSDLFPEIQDEVRRQIEEMQNLDDLTDPNFGDADLQLAAYAAALRVLTGYAEIDEIDVEWELRRTRARGEESPLARLIRQAVRIASDYLVPKGLEPATWRKLLPEERLYLKGIETEASGEAREGVYQELARGYGAGPHRELYASRAANRVRFKTPTEFGSRDLRRIGEEGFAGSTVRQLLLAIAGVAAHAERDPRPARVSLRAALPNYWTERERLADLLVWLSDRASTLPQWRADAEAARLLAASLRNDNV